MKTAYLLEGNKNRSKFESQWYRATRLLTFGKKETAKKKETADDSGLGGGQDPLASRWQRPAAPFSYGLYSYGPEMPKTGSTF